MKILFFIVSIVGLHALYNLINFFRYPIVRKNLFYNYSSDSSDKIKAITHKTQITNYIKYANVKDKYIVVTQPTGYGQLASSKVSVLDNVLNTREDIAYNVITCLIEAKGNYWSRFINSFNPFYWLKIIIFIPKYILSYLGINEESVVVKVFQIIYWLLATVCTFCIAIFPDEIKNFIYLILNIS